MKQATYRGLDQSGTWRFGYLLKIDNSPNYYIREMNPKDEPPRYTDYLVDSLTIGAIAPRQADGQDVYVGDYVSNNFGIGAGEKEVIREVTFLADTFKLTHRRGKTRLATYLPLIDHIVLNYKVVGNRFENPELLIFVPDEH